MFGKQNPKSDGKFYRGINGPPHVLELLWSKHVEREESVAAKAATDKAEGISFAVKSFGPVSLPPPVSPRALALSAQALHTNLVSTPFIFATDLNTP